jgi:hypothetical protein
MTSLQKKPGMRAAINGKCKDCIFDPLAGGTWRQQVAQCSCPDCALWPLRPMPHSGPFSDAPTDPNTVTRVWLGLPTGNAELAAKTGKSGAV